MPCHPYASRVSESLQPAFRRLIATAEPAHLGPERRQSALGEAELRAAVRDAVSGSGLPDSQARLILAHVLLWHDCLDASHTLSQAIDTPDGSFLHAIMHRREPDYWNSKYWWRQAGRHPAFDDVGRRAGGCLQSAGRADLGELLLPDGVWQPSVFVDACESVASRSGGDPEVMVLRLLQQIEFEVLLERWLQK